MSDNHKRKEMLRAMLANDPEDAELRYFLAMEHVSEGNEQQALEELRSLTAGTTYVPAFLQAGQLLNRLHLTDEATVVLRKGIAEAERQKNDHARSEMQGLLDSLQ